VRIYWSVGSIPELADLPERQRERLWRKGYRASLGTRATKTATLAAVTIAALGYLVGHPAATAGGALAGGILLFQVASHQARPFLREERAKWAATDPAAGEGSSGEPKV
jgi:hypothetical protein